MVKHEIIGLWWWGKDCSLWGGVMVIACQIYDWVYLSHMSVFRDNHGIIGIVNETDMVPHSGNLLCLWPTSRGAPDFRIKTGFKCQGGVWGDVDRDAKLKVFPAEDDGRLIWTVNSERLSPADARLGYEDVVSVRDNFGPLYDNLLSRWADGNIVNG